MSKSDLEKKKGRATLLLAFCELEPAAEDVKCFCLNCSWEVSTLISRLVTNCPSIEEETECTKGCFRRKSVPIKCFEKEVILSGNQAPGQMAQNCFLEGEYPCGTNDGACTGIQKTTLTEIGECLLIVS